MPFWLTLLLFAAFTVLGELLRPKPNLKDAQPAGLGDFQFPTASEDRRIPLLWGTVQIRGPNVVWYGDLLQEAIEEEVKTGLWSSETFIKGYRYYIGMQFAVCEGPVDNLRRMWIKDTLVVDGTLNPVTHGGTFTIDQPKLFGGDDHGTGGFVGTFEFFAGTSDQVPSTYLGTFQVEGGSTPAYRDTCYLAPETTAPYVGNSTSIDAPRFEIQRIATSEANPLSLATPTVGTLDANPSNVIYELMTNTDWGMKIGAATIDTTSFTDAADTLATEGNGFSMVLDGDRMNLGELLNVVEKQIDGAVYFDISSGKWKLALARDDYDETLLVEFTDAESGGNILEVETFTRGTWEETSNVVSIQFVDRSDEYKSTSATAQNDANIEIQGGNLIYAGDRYPGVKEGALADSIAWRDLRTVSTPLAQARVVTDRTTYAVNPLDVVKLSFMARDFAVSELLMRVKSIDRGDIADGRIVYELVEDVFRAGSGSYGAPPGTDWEPPVTDLAPFPTDEQVAFEAPRALTSRDPLGDGPTDDKVYASARQQDSAVSFEIRARHASGAPSGAYSRIGEVFAFCRIGSLDGTVSVGDAVPRATLTINSDPDAQSAILATLPGSAAAAPDPNEMGTGLLGLILVDAEFMLVSYAQAGAGTDVDLKNVYRGALDSVQADHAANADVFLLFVGSGISLDSITAGHNVDVKLIPDSFADTVDEAEATTISFTMANRTRRPYAPSEMSVGGTRFATTVSLEVGGTGETDGITLSYFRRDFRTENEVASLEADAGDLATDFPTANDTTHEVEVVNDPDGTPTSLLTWDLGSIASGEVPRLEILKATDGILPTRLRFQLRANHDFEAATWTSRYDLVWDFDVTSSLTGRFNFGALDTDEVSNVYTADAAGTHPFTLSTAFATGDVEYRLNGGGWAVLIAATTTSGNIAGVTLGDTIEVRHRSAIAGSLKLLSLAAPGLGTDGYGVLFA